jgi:hypothetical protein
MICAASIKPKHTGKQYKPPKWKYIPYGKFATYAAGVFETNHEPS